MIRCNTFKDEIEDEKEKTELNKANRNYKAKDLKQRDEQYKQKYKIEIIAVNIIEKMI